MKLMPSQESFQPWFLKPRVVWRLYSVNPSPSASPSVEGTDQSAAVLSARLPAVKGSSVGTLDRHPATLNVADVRATAGGTMLTFWYTGAAKDLTNFGEYSWQRLPVIVDVAGKKVYEPLTFTNERGETLCLCTDTASVSGEPQPRTAPGRRGTAHGRCCAATSSPWRG